MLLTSSQVSVAVSSGVVFLCTAALFLSGYVIQQRTLRDLRAAIKPSPRPSPKIFLPDRFQKSTTELDDGTIVAVQDDVPRRRKQNGGIVVEVKQTVAEPERVGDASVRGEQKPVGVREAGEAEGPTRTQRDGKGEEERVEKPISRAERRRRIKEEIMRLSEGEERGYYQRRLW
ncbi:hypothetical protein QBC39DRAFT_432643 [Podospora conica]|nr:hypothetical protein QBC39DRAFT_432643 [Schizothecium conicum]